MRLPKIARKILVNLARPVIRAAQFAVPVNRRIVICAGKPGKFTGNSRQMFQYLEMEENVEVYWYTYDREIARRVEVDHPGKVLFARSPRAVWKMLRAGIVFTAHDTSDFFPYNLAAAKKRIVHLGHGVPLKTMGVLQPNAAAALTHEIHQFDYLVCCSEFDRDILARCYAFDPERILITGLPRNDALFSKETRPGQLTPILRQKVVLYAPTWRDQGMPPPILPVGVDADALEQVLSKHDAYLLVRPHYYDPRNGDLSNLQSTHSRIIVADDTIVPDVNDLLPHVDVLVSDYSSIYIDYLLLDRPMIFCPYDLEDYSQYRGFLFDYRQHTPGEHAIQPDEFLAALARALSGSDPVAAERRRVRDLFHANVDSESSRRLWSIVKSLPQR